MPESMKHPARPPFKRREVKGAHVNQSLSSPPSHEAVCRVLLDLTKRDADYVAGKTTRAIYGRRWHGDFSASVIAAECGVEGAQRLGRGAVKGSWSGTMSGALRISPTLRSMVTAGLLHQHYDTENHRSLYGLTDSGRKLAEGEKSDE